LGLNVCNNYSHNRTDIHNRTVKITLCHFQNRKGKWFIEC